MQLQVTYCSNYNGVHVEIDGVTIGWNTNPSVDAMTEEMVDWAVDFCDGDGFFDGDFDVLKTEFIAIAKKHFGEDISVEVNEDSFSS